MHYVNSDPDNSCKPCYFPHSSIGLSVTASWGGGLHSGADDNNDVCINVEKINNMYSKEPGVNLIDHPIYVECYV